MCRAVMFYFLVAIAARGAVALSYRTQLEDGAAATLTATIQASSVVSGVVTINGVDTRRPTLPFRFDWGDGEATQGFFPASHTYADRARNHLITVTASYGDGSAGSTVVALRFVAPVL